MTLGNKMLKSFLWSGMERVAVQLISFTIGIILARLLLPEDYGLIGLLTVFISFCQVFIDSGFSKALIQKKNRSIEDISTIFYFNLFVAIISFIILNLLAPLIANYYNLQKLNLLLRILSFSLIINAITAIPTTLLTIKLDFKSLFKINFISTFISGIVAIYFAYCGYGVWALVIQTILKSIILSILLWLILKWLPIWKFSIKSLKNLFSFGSKILISSLLSNIVNNIYALFIVKYFNAKELGFYTRGSQFPDVISNLVGSVMDSVLLPTLSQIQDDSKLLVQYTKKTIKAIGLITVPLFFGLAFLAKPLIELLLTEKWLSVVPIMQILCIARLITNISGINVNLIYVIGRTDLALRQQYLKIVIRVLFIIIALKYGIIAIAWAELISTLFHFFINTYYPGKIMKYGAFSQIKDLFKIILAGGIMLCSMYIIDFWIIDNLMKVLILTLVGCLVFLSSAYLLKINEFLEIKYKIFELIKNRNK